MILLLSACVPASAAAYQFSVDSALLLALVGAGLALIFDYFPSVRTWFDALTDAQKRLLNAGLILLAAVVLFAGDCLAVFDTNLVCDTRGALDTVYLVFLAITVNQGVHLALKPSASLKAKLLK
jgi:hypothetical protein